MRRILSLPVLWYLRLLARIALLLNPPVIIGVAGSVGKSSTRNALYSVVKDFAPTKVISGNSETGIPLGLLGITAADYRLSGWIRMLLRAPFGLFYLRNTQYLIVEMGIDDPYPPKNMSYLLTILRPDYAVSLNISPTHTEQFEKTLKEKQARSLTDEHKLGYILRRIAEEDTKVITASGCKVGIYNADDPYIKHEIDKYLVLHRKTTLLSFGKGSNNDITYGSYEVTLRGTTFTFLLQTQSKREKIQLVLDGYVLPKENREVLAAALLTASAIGVSPRDMKDSFERNFTLPKGRSTIFPGVRKSVIIDSSYNASPSAVNAFLSLFATLRTQEKRPTALLFGDMRELGDAAEEAHEAVAKRIPDTVEYVYLVGQLTKQYMLPILEQNRKITDVRWFSDARAAGRYLQTKLPERALLLVKGSQNTIFLEEAVALLLADKHDRVHLCRQDTYWRARKEAFFRRIEK